MEGGDAKGSVCVTGGTGYVASWLIMKLLEHGYRVRTTVRSDNPGGAAGVARSSPVLRREVSVWKVAFSNWVKTLVRALEDSHGSGSWYVMAITVNMSTENTKTEKHTFVISFNRFCPIGSVVEFNSFIDPNQTHLNFNEIGLPTDFFEV